MGLDANSLDDDCTFSNILEDDDSIIGNGSLVNNSSPHTFS